MFRSVSLVYGMLAMLSIASESARVEGELALVEVHGRVVDESGVGIRGVSLCVVGAPVRTFWHGDQGVVLEESLDYLPWAGSAAFSQSAAKRAQSGSDGAFTVAIPPGDAPTLYAHASGFETREMSLHADGSVPVEVELQAAGVLFVRVIASGNVESAQVAVRRHYSAENSFLSIPCPFAALPTTDAGGDGGPAGGSGSPRQWSGLASGVGPVSAEVVVEAPGYARTVLRVGGVEPGAVGAVTVELPIQSVIQGLVRGAAGAPVSRADVRLVGAGSSKRRILKQVSVSMSGEFEFGELAPGDYGLYARTVDGRESDVVRVVIEEAGELSRVPIWLPEYVECQFQLAARDGELLSGRDARVVPVQASRFYPSEQSPEFELYHKILAGGVLPLRGALGSEFEVTVGGLRALVSLSSCEDLVPVTVVLE